MNKETEFIPARTLTLKHPIKWGSDGPITELRFRRPKFKDIRLAENKSATATTINLLARITGLTPAAIEEMDGEDIVEASRIIQDFLPTSPVTGRDGSEF